MKKIIEKIVQNSTKYISKTVVIGAGDGRHLNSLRKLSSRKLFLAEAHPYQVKKLIKKLKEGCDEFIIESAITVNSDAMNVNLNPMSNLSYSSIFSPERLIHHYPNIYMESPVSIKSKTCATLMRELNIDQTENNILIIDAPGQAFQLLTNIKENNDLLSFSWLLVNGNIEPLYSHEVEIDTIAEWLKKSGFEILGENQEIFLPKKQYLFKLNTDYAEKERLKSEIEALRKSISINQPKKLNSTCNTPQSNSPKEYQISANQKTNKK